MVTAIKPQTLDTAPRTLALRFLASELKTAAATLARIADAKAHLPILGMVRIQVTPTGIVTLSATDLNLSVSCSGPAWYGTAGDLCVPAKQLADIVKASPAEMLTLADTGDGPMALRVASGDTEITLLARPGYDFPKLPDAHADDIPWTMTNGAALADLFERVESAICKDETRFHLNGVRIEGGRLESTRMVTTDGHRLVRSDGPCSGFHGNPQNVILPAKAAKEIAKILRTEKGAQAYWASKGALLYVKVGAWTVAAKLIDAQFPTYSQVIPTDNAKLATVERKPLIAALKRAKKALGAKHGSTRGVAMAFASGKLTLTAEHPDAGTSSETLVAESEWLACGGTVRVGFNPCYLIDALESIDCKHVTMAMGADLDPVVVRGTDDAVSYGVESSRHLVVIMPMRL